MQESLPFWPLSTFVAGYEPFSAEFIVGNLFDSISRLGVPLFLMISGALFLDEHRQITIRGILCKNVKTIAWITLVWAVIYFVACDMIWGSDTVTVKQALIGILDGHYHMWYLYVIIGLYIITPFLRKFTTKENKHLVLFFIAVSFVVQFMLPTLSMMLSIPYLRTWINKFHPDFFDGYVTYFLLGWYIVHIGIGQKRLRQVIYLMSALSLISMILYSQFSGYYKVAYQNIGLFTPLYAAGVFLALNNLNLACKEKTARRLTELSKLTFGTYLVHILVLSVFNKTIIYSRYPALHILVSFAVVSCGSLLISYILSRIPVLKKIIKA